MRKLLAALFAALVLLASPRFPNSAASAAQVPAPTPVVQPLSPLDMLKLLREDEREHPHPKCDPKAKHCVPVVDFDADVDDESVGKAIKAMQEAVDVGADTVIMVINTDGGLYDAGLRLAKAIESLPVPVHCVVDGKASSMGYYILQSCDVRSMTKRSTLMVHNAYMRGTTVGPGNSLANAAAHLRALNDAMLYQYRFRTNVTEKEMRERVLGDLQWWLTWGEALKRKMIDSAVDSVLPLQRGYMRRK